MADDTTEQLEEVQHPTLGPLKFPTSMGPDDRNAAIEHLETMHGPKTAKEAVQNPMVSTPPLAGKMNMTGVITGHEYTPGQEKTYNTVRAAEAPSDQAIEKGTEAVAVMAPVVATGGEPATMLQVGKGLLGTAAGTVAGSAAGKYAGGAIGDVVGHPEMGREAGATIGGVAGGILGGGLGSHIDLPTDQEYINPMGLRMRNPIYRPPGGVGANLPDAGEFYQNEGTERNAIFKRQQIEDKTNAAAEARRPENIVQRRAGLRQAESDRIGVTPFEALPEQEQAEALMRRGGEQGAIDKTEQERVDAERSVRGNEGSPARWTNDRVQELAKQGNREAIMELRQRGLEPPLNSRYVAGDISNERTRTGPLSMSRLETEPQTITPGGKIRGVKTSQPRMTIKFDDQGNPVLPDANPEEPPAAQTVSGKGPIRPQNGGGGAAAAPGAPGGVERRGAGRMSDEDFLKYHSPDKTDDEYRTQLEDEVKSSNSTVARTAQARLDNLNSKAAPIKYETSDAGINYAVGPQDVRVSIPPKLPREQWESYAKGKIEEQAAMQRSRGIIK